MNGCIDGRVIVFLKECTVGKFMDIKIPESSGVLGAIMAARDHGLACLDNPTTRTEQQRVQILIKGKKIVPFNDCVYEKKKLSQGFEIVVGESMNSKFSIEYCRVDDKDYAVRIQDNYELNSIHLVEFARMELEKVREVARLRGRDEYQSLLN